MDCAVADDEDIGMQRRILMDLCEVAWSSILLLPGSDSPRHISIWHLLIIDALLGVYVKLHNKTISS